MENKNKIIVVLIIILTMCVIGFCIYSVINKKDNVESDAIKFRQEYMELNDKVNENTGKPYVNVTISETNTVKYADEDEIVDILNNRTGIIYFGYKTCPWCRSLLPTLTKIAEENNETIYYLDIYDIRSSFELKDNSVNKVKDGSSGYYKILRLLDSYLEDFYLTDDEGNKFDTKEKRLYAPTVVAVSNGEVKSIHVGTVSSQESAYDKLTNEQTKELEEIIEKLIDSKNSNVCSKGKC